MQTLTAFKMLHCTRPYKPDAAMNERWQTRIVPQKLALQGEHGAQAYLQNYGKGIGLDKLVKLARTCEHYGAIALAAGFWKAAYELAKGEPPPREAEPAPLPEVESAPQPEPDAAFPPHLQPGRLATMQPTDARRGREFYIQSPDYAGQPKRDGHRAVLFAAPAGVTRQARSLAVEPLNGSLGRAAQAVAQSCGPFILDGELFYRDCQGGEHRTGAQAAAANAGLGRPAAPVAPAYAIFDCLYAGGQDLTGQPAHQRLAAAETLAAQLADLEAAFEFLAPIVTPEGKAALAAAQREQGREGEVWRYVHAAYRPGKQGGDPEPIVRTKHLTERVVRVTGFTRTTATKNQNRRFAAIEVADPATGKPLGCVGTGFTDAQQGELLAAFAQGELLIEVVSQGVTEFGVLWQPRFRDIAARREEAEPCGNT